VSNVNELNQQLIPVIEGEIGGVKQPVVDARTLHGVMGVRAPFAHWLKRRIDRYGFQEGFHFERQIFTSSGEILLAKSGRQNEGRGGHNRIECVISLSMGKEISMVEPTEMGQQARRYFIECERRLSASADSQLDTKLSDEDERECKAIGAASDSAIFFWTLEKRSRIYHAGMNRIILFSITCDIRESIFREIKDDFQQYLDDNNDLSFLDQINFLKTWEPQFFRNEKINKKSV